ncbi:MAG: ankyrin repeat domain-containing protein [Oligoflexia bacterium]|nr:ankyrin repeat domain-containing protein [Oligoflexia bacterium]
MKSIKVKQLFYLLVIFLCSYSFIIILAVGKDKDKGNEPQELKLSRDITPLELAVINNDFDRVKKLATAKNINIKDSDQGFPLMYAVYNDNLQIAEFLLQNGAKVDNKMREGITPIYLAVTRNEVSMVELLIKYKADVNQNIKGTTLIDYAKIAKYYEIKGLLLNAGAKEREVLVIPPIENQNIKSSTNQNIPKKTN